MRWNELRRHGREQEWLVLAGAGKVGRNEII